MTDREPRPGAEPELPDLVDPVMITAFEGWNDAGLAASITLEHLELSWDATHLTSIDPEEYYDFQVTRPLVRQIGGVIRRIEWQTTRLSICRPPGIEHDVVLVNGIEPNVRWRAFCAELLGYIEQLGVTKVINLGGLSADIPHTRPTSVGMITHDRATMDELGVEATNYEGPTGIVGVLHDACVSAGVPVVSFWATVPNYVAQAKVPKAAVALLHRIEELLDVEVPLGELPEQAEEWERTVSEMAEADEEVSEYIRQLEEQTEDDDSTAAEQMRSTSGDTIAADFERYLRRRGSGGAGS